MMYLVAALVVAVLVLWILWKRASAIASRAQDTVTAMERSMHVAQETSERHRRIIENKESELRALREAHSIVSQEIQAAAKVIHETGGNPEKVAGLWNKTFSGESQ